MESNKPLVSIMIPNYNYSRYLDGCIQSALQQTYSNLEIVILDNASQDKSIHVASRYNKDGIRICRNPANILNTSYKILANMLTQGKYMILLCSDDLLETDFIEKAVNIMEHYPNVGYVQGERKFIMDTGEIITSDPFYNCSFIAPGRETMPIYMMTPVAHPSQGLYRRKAFQDIGGYDMEIDHMNADRALWFYLSYVSDCAYIQSVAAKIRIGHHTETSYTIRNFQHLILSHLTIKDFVHFAKEKNLSAVYLREDEALLKFANDILNDASQLLLEHDFEKAYRYLLYSKIVSRKTEQTDRYKMLCKMCLNKKCEQEIILENKQQALKHKRNYAPPSGYKILSEPLFAITPNY